MATQTPEPGKTGTEPGGSTGVPSNMSLSTTQQKRGHHFLHHNANNVVIKIMTQDAHLKTVRKTGSSKNMEQHPIGCEYIHIKVNDGQLTV
jgi:hypothetical protein